MFTNVSVYQNTNRLEHDYKYVVEVELPDLVKEDILVAYTDGALALSFKSKEVDNLKDKVKHIYVPSDVDDARFSSKFEDGVLFIFLFEKENKVLKSNNIAINIE